MESELKWDQCVRLCTTPREITVGQNISVFFSQRYWCY